MKVLIIELHSFILSLTHSFLSNHAAMATIVQYIVNEDGRNAVEAMNMPQLVAMKRNVQRAI